MLKFCTLSQNSLSGLLNFTDTRYLACSAYPMLSKMNKTHDFEQIADLRSDLLRFARLQLNDTTQAEDAVHEAIDAALASNTFSGKGSLKSWVFAILRNKIIDLIREQHKTASVSYIEEAPENSDTLFDNRGYWKKTHQPANWQRPENTLANQQFLNIFEQCIKHLPANTAKVFMMREHLGMSIHEICEALELSESNCWVIMHRARAQLRACLEGNLIEKNALNMES
ncbi:RNA polymerase sigma-70 factor [hydrothermal vent metagenome]|uniref:RNA polymerase sigma-70 factor n=1 Tax=hydrothermal vent metagenome TaxID=652676 RepID=A0A3B0XGF6_9ZZZZ